MKDQTFKAYFGVYYQAYRCLGTDNWLHKTPFERFFNNFATALLPPQTKRGPFRRRYCKAVTIFSSVINS